MIKILVKLGIISRYFKRRGYGRGGFRAKTAYKPTRTIIAGPYKHSCIYTQ